jgi:hypothetical protein
VHGSLLDVESLHMQVDVDNFVEVEVIYYIYFVFNENLLVDLVNP